MEDDIVLRLEKRAEIRRSMKHRKSVQEGKPDRIAELLEEAAKKIRVLREQIEYYADKVDELKADLQYEYEQQAGEDL